MTWNDPAARAREFIAFCDGAEQFGFVDYARRGRDLARELLDALEMIQAERSARIALQKLSDPVAPKDEPR